jgi:hypothetical protein
LNNQEISFSAEAAYIIRVLAGFSSQAGKEEIEYRVIAINKSGEGQASNTAMMIL